MIPRLSRGKEEKMTRYNYTVRTDAVLVEDIRATDIDHAAGIFARAERIVEEFPRAARMAKVTRVRTVAQLIRIVEAIGDGAWLWIEGDAPDGARQRV